MDLVLGKPNKAIVIKNLRKLTQSYEFFVQLILTNGSTSYFGNSFPQKFTLIVQTPNNAPYFMTPLENIIEIDLKALKN